MSRTAEYDNALPKILQAEKDKLEKDIASLKTQYADLITPKLLEKAKIQLEDTIKEAKEVAVQASESAKQVIEITKEQARKIVEDARKEADSMKTEALKIRDSNKSAAVQLDNLMAIWKTHVSNTLSMKEALSTNQKVLEDMKRKFKEEVKQHIANLTKIVG